MKRISWLAIPVLSLSVWASPAKRATWNPPSNLVQPLTEVWNHEVATYNMNFKNFGYVACAIKLSLQNFLTFPILFKV